MVKMDQQGVSISNVTLTYGRKAKPTLNKMNMNIAKGTM